MPNNVYAQISVDEKYADKLQKISKVGLCRYYTPMPVRLVNTTSPVRIVSQKDYDDQMEKNKTEKFKSYPLTKYMQIDLIERYGEGIFIKGYYKDYCLSDYLGSTIEEATEELA